MQHLLHQCGGVASAGWCRPAAAAWPQQNFIHTQLYSLQSTQAHCSLPPCQQQQGQLKLTVTQFVLLLMIFNAVSNKYKNLQYRWS